MASEKIKSSEITDEGVYNNRRKFLKRSALAIGSGLATIGAYSILRPTPFAGVNTPDISQIVKQNGNDSLVQTPLEDIASYNNFYEFTTSKNGVGERAEGFETKPWQILVDGMVRKPKVYGFEDLLKFEQEERVYRFRCVEGWSMVIPWVGIPLAKILKDADPLNEAKYVAFQTFYPGLNPEQLTLPKNEGKMQSSFRAGISFPYVEGLRIDEAMHDLTLIATGVYGKLLPTQNGAPLRLVVPWKYGFKSIKSIVKISLTDKQPPTTWNLSAPNEYGFYSNVNPDVAHPRWSQATERRIGEIGQRNTEFLNGYAEQVGHLYKGMDLTTNF